MLAFDLTSIIRTVVIGILSYTALIILLRLSGKRTLSKMNAFDLIVTVALGSSLATMLLSSDSFFDGLAAFTTLIGLQFVITWLSIRSEKFHNFVKAQPQLLLFEGEFIEQSLVKERVTKAEIKAAIRSQGISQLEDVEAVVLETDGSLTTLQRVHGKLATTLQGVNTSSKAESLARKSQLG